MNGRLLLCCKCYAVAIERAESMTTDSKCESILSLKKKYGETLDKLGKWYMKEAQSCLQKAGERFPKEEFQEFESFYKESLSCFESGMSKFKSVDDKAGNAKVMLNIGRLHCLKAKELCSRTARNEFSKDERFFFEQAIICFKKAFKILKQGKSFEEILELINFNIAETYFEMYKQLQDHPPLSACAQEEV
ncbi:erythroid differentiation-related factor 1-like [Mytilus galloprovincialis]|uniref:erythroid differentiation-related factor 1-like n=1 Tax=Mytilus galloprovincialis TaxID=29158 RepID=UPI003F7BA6E0